MDLLLPDLPTAPAQPNGQQLTQTFQSIRFLAELARSINAARSAGTNTLVGINLPKIPTTLPRFENPEEGFSQLINLTDEQAEQLLRLFAAEFDLPLNTQTEELLLRGLHMAACFSTLLYHLPERD